MKRLEQMAPDLVLPRDTWTPADEALYGPIDLFRVPLDEAQAMQLKAMRYAFTHHYDHNKFYHKYCQEENVSPDDIKTTDDLKRIPLIPDSTFKQHPSGRDFAYWIATVFTGKLPKIFIKSADPTLEDVLRAFEAAGITVVNSSGTSGLVTFIPKDATTLTRAFYSYTKTVVNLYDFSADHALMCFPKPGKTRVAASILGDSLSKLARKVHYFFDFEMPAGTMQRAMSGNTKPEGASGSSSQSDMLQRTIARIVRCLERLSKTGETFFVVIAPFMLFDVMNTLQKEGQSFDFGERGLICTGGGWKIRDGQKISYESFRKRVEEVLGIPEARCTDVYSMAELDEICWPCPEGHYRHLPHTHLKPFVLDRDFAPIGYGERGRFAFLDALANSYPGFFMTGDEVKMLEHCPVCDRPGPVLEPEIERAKGVEVRGCADAIQRVLQQELEAQ
ncbi:MAG: LuxE/PaaK family acyltransferase [Halobacteriota archaeon]